jgi:hypothetical protein
MAKSPELTTVIATLLHPRVKLPVTPLRLSTARYRASEGWAHDCICWKMSSPVRASFEVYFGSSECPLTWRSIIRESVLRSTPITCAARDLFPPTAFRTRNR